MNKNSNEHLEAVAFNQWAKLSEKKYPALNMLFAIPNGGKLPYTKIARGKIFSPQRLLLVQEGLKKGIPDYFLAWPSNGYHGLFIELKYGKNKCSLEQLDWIDKLRVADYMVEVCYGFEKARDMVIDYLNGHYAIVKEGANSIQNYG